MDAVPPGDVTGRVFACVVPAVPSSYLLVSDMDGVKMVSVDGSDDKSVYVAAVGRPFSSNLVALAYDAGSNTAYYSDVRRYAS